MSCCWAINSFFLLWLSFLVSASSFFTFSSWALVSAWSYFLQYIAFLHYQFCSLQYIALYYYLHHQFSLTNSAYIYHLAQWFLMFEERNEIFNVWGKKWKWTIFPPTNVESFEIYTQGGGGVIFYCTSSSFLIFSSMFETTPVRYSWECWTKGII